MTNSPKISELTAASPLTGTETFPLVQNGTTVKGQVSDVLTYASANGPYAQSVATLAAMKALTTRPDVVIGEDGAIYGPFRWASGSVLTADDTHVVTPTSGEAGQYLRITSGFNQARTTGASLYQGLPTKGINETLAQDLFDLGYNAVSVLRTGYVVDGLTTAAKDPSTGATLDYLVMDDNYRLHDWTNSWILNSRNTLRHATTNTQQSLDVGPDISLNRQVSNAAVGSNLGTVGAKGVGSMIYGVLTGTDPFAVNNGSPTVTVTLTNHNLTVGEYVYFPVAITGRGTAFGGSADTASNNNNKYGSYYVQSTPTANTFTITLNHNATSTGSFGGSSVYMNWPQYRKTMAAGPFTTTNGSSTVTVSHTNHQLSPASGTNPGNPRASTSNPSHVFYEGASAVGGATIKGDHVVQTCPDANSYTITINAVSDVTASPTAATGGGTPTYSHGGDAVDLLVASMQAVILSSNANNPSGQFQFVFGSPPNYGAGNASAWVLGLQGFYATYLDPLASPGEGGIHARRLMLTSPTSTDNNVEIDTTTSGQNSYISLKRGGTSKTLILADSSNLFRLFDDDNNVNFLTYSNTTAALTLGINSDISIPGGGGVNFATKATTLTSASDGAGLNLPHGAAPSSPVNGDMWTTTSGLFVRINGSTVGPLS